MIHTLLNLTRPLFILDTETTGVHPEARIIELGFQEWRAAQPPCTMCETVGNHVFAERNLAGVPPHSYMAGGLVKEWRSFINPGIPIPTAVIAIHGITNDMVSASPRFAQIAHSLAGGLSNCDFGGKNIRFDLVRLTYEFQLAKVPWSYAGACIIDGERLEQITHPRALSDLYLKYKGEELDGAHGALADARASTEVIVGQLTRFESLPRNLKALHELQWPGWLTSDGSFKMVNGVPTCMLKKYQHVPMTKVPIDYYNWILTANFPEDVRKLVSEAKMGKFPIQEEQ